MMAEPDLLHATRQRSPARWDDDQPSFEWGAWTLTGLKALQEHPGVRLWLRHGKRRNQLVAR